MKYEYVYKSSDGVRHVGEMIAPSRDEAFQTLRAKGIRPIKVTAADGSKENGEVRVVGVRKRVTVVLVVVSIALGMTFGSYYVTRTNEPYLTDNAAVEFVQPAHQAIKIAKPLPRQMIQGDRSRIENLPTNLFSTVAEAYLARFAEPGRDFGGVIASTLATNDVALLEMLNAPIHIAADEFSEHLDLKRITAGIKREMRQYIRGGGTPQEYLTELVMRQQKEISYRRKASQKLAQMITGENADLQAAYDYWLKANAQLQSMGIYPLPLPEALLNLQTPLGFD